MTKRNKDKQTKILEIHHHNPCVSYTDIGKMVNLSRERIRQICGNRHTRLSELNRIKNMVTLVCPHCGRAFSRKEHYIIEGKKKGTKNFFCSRRCRALFNASIFMKHRKTMRQCGTVKRNKRILGLYEYGCAQSELGRMFDLSQSRISHIIKRMRNKKRRYNVDGGRLAGVLSKNYRSTPPMQAESTEPASLPARGGDKNGTDKVPRVRGNY